MRIAIADDHALVRKGVEVALRSRPEFRVVGELTGPTELLNFLDREPCDVVVADVNMPNDSTPDGQELFRRLRAVHPQLGIVALTADTDVIRTKLMLSAGIDAFVHKSSPAAELVYAIERVTARSGVQYICDLTQQRLMSSGHTLNEGLALLSNCELDVIELLKSGWTVSRIAKLRKRTVATISHQKISAMRKLKASGDAELYAALGGGRKF